MKKFLLLLLLLQGIHFPQDSLTTVQPNTIDVFRALQVADSIRKADSLYKATLLKEMSSLRDYEISKRSVLQNKLNQFRMSDSLKKITLKQHLDSLKAVVTGFPVVPYEDTLLFVYNKSGVFSPAERAAEFTKRILDLEDIFDPETDSLTITITATSVDISYKDKIVLSVSEMDALWNNKTKVQLAEIYKKKITEAVVDYQDATGWLNVLKQIFLALLVIFVTYFMIKYTLRYFRKIDKFIYGQKDKRIHSISIKNYEVLNAETLVKFIQLFFTGLKYFVIGFMLYLAIPILFSIFPMTKNIASTLFSYVLDPLSSIYHSIIDYIPNLFKIIVVFIITNYAIKVVKYFSEEIEKKNLTIKGFYSDWAKPTFNIIRFLLYAFMFVIVFPYLPGSDSAVFQGVSVFVGIIFSLGSSSAISNMVAGLVMTYMRSFKIGDRIKINEIIGNVIEKTPIVTRIRTIKNEIITIPNSSVLTTNITNYTASAEEAGLILHTTITIGYDVSWRQVHELLYSAAEATQFILKSPKPFILQTSLDDFYVSYQINAYTKEADRQAGIYSDLHQNIQDKFNEAGVEIMSPHYRADRDGSDIAIPKNYKKE